MKIPRYGKLSARLRELGLTQNDLAYALSLSPGPVSQRMQGDVAWNIEEMYRTMELCRISPEEMHIYFPDPTTTKKRGNCGCEIVGNGKGALECDTEAGFFRRSCGCGWCVEVTEGIVKEALAEDPPELPAKGRNREPGLPGIRT